MLIINDSLLYGGLLGMTGKGYVDFDKETLKIKGEVIPAYHLNNLFGIADLPIIGDVVAGEKGGGVISAKYSIRGDLKEPEFKVKALSAIVPNVVKNIVDKLKFW